MRKRDSKTMDLRVELNRALQTGRSKQALELYELIEKQKPDEPRWAHRKAELLHRMGRDDDAVLAYERAVDLYAAKGFEACASATAKVMLELDPTKHAVLERVEAQATRRLERERSGVHRLARHLHRA